MNETTKWHEKRLKNGDYEKYIKGQILDIGCGNDPVKSPFGKTEGWDLPDGDGAILQTIPNKVFDCIYASHSLEHMRNVEIALSNWHRVLKPGGYLYIVVPDFELYEKGRWPSTYAGSSHLFSFSINLTRGDVGRINHYNICMDLFPIFKNLNTYIETIQFGDFGFNYDTFEVDQTLINAESQITIIARKK